MQVVIEYRSSTYLEDATPEEAEQLSTIYTAFDNHVSIKRMIFTHIYNTCFILITIIWQ